ncbi:MAG: GNAT family N-acetyltransferase [Ignavibacteria bacterium]
MTFEEIAGYCLAKPYAEETYPFDETTMVMKIRGKMFALLDSTTMEKINLKHPSDDIPVLLERYECISPGYHMSKKHWVTVHFKHADMRDQDIIKLIDISYDLIVDALPKKFRIPLTTSYTTFTTLDAEYQESLFLRQTILRDPLNLTLTEDDLIGEDKEIHIGGMLQGRLIACCILSPRDGIQAKVRQVAVDTRFQGMGIGSALMNHAESIALNMGIESIILHARKHVAQWYESQHYEILGDEFTEVGIPHVCMIKYL